MRLFILLLLVFNFVHSLEIKLNYGKEDSDFFAVVNVNNNHPFECKYAVDDVFSNEYVKCDIEGIPQSGFNPIEGTFASLYYNMKDELVDGKKVRYVSLFIKPKNNYRLKLFSSFFDLKTELPVPVNRDKLSRSYQIVVFKDKLPFLDDKLDKSTSQDSINFPITIVDSAAPQLPELDINRKPLSYTAGKDLEIFLDIKDQIKQKKYKNALIRISDGLQKYPNSLFQKDMIYYAMIALSKDRDKNSQDLLIDYANKWIRVYSSDGKISEVMYLLANAYRMQNKIKEAYHYYNRNIDEYPQSRYAPLSQMQIANTLTSQADIRRAPLIYRDAYKNAKDLESASEIALFWAIFDLRNQNTSNALELIKKIKKANPTFFISHIDQGKLLLKVLQEADLKEMAGDLARYLSQGLPIKSSEHRDMLYLASTLLYNAQSFNLAHQTNLEFLNIYPGTDFAKKVKQRDDGMLFDVKGNDDDQLDRYDRIIANYPSSQNAKEAALLKAKLLLKLKRYQEVLDMEAPKDLHDIALSEEAKILIQSGSCVKLNAILKNEESIDIDVENGLLAFKCLVDSNSHDSADKLFSNLIAKIDKAKLQLEWLYLQSKNLFALKKDSDGVRAGEDALNLAFSMGQEKYYDISFDIFNSLIHRDESKALLLSKKMKKWFKDDKRMLVTYHELLKLAQKNKDYLSIKNEAINILSLQNNLKNYSYSPYINFIYIDILMDEKDFNKALKELEVIEKMDINNDDKQQLLYKKANIFYATNLDNKEILQECVKINADNAWGNLCKNAISIQEDVEY